MCYLILFSLIPEKVREMYNPFSINSLGKLTGKIYNQITVLPHFIKKNTVC